MEHLIFSCNKSVELWNAVYSWTGFALVMPIEGKNHFIQHRGMVRGKVLKQNWLILWFATVWSIWTSRNGKIFNQESQDAAQNLEMIKVRA